MNFETAPAAINAFFAAAWGSTSQVAYDDVKFDVPNSLPWVRLNVRHIDGYQASMGSPGNNKFRRIGNVTAQVFAPVGNAKKTALQLAQQIVNIFRGAEHQGISFYNVVSREIGADGHGFYQINVTAEFRYDEIA